MERFVDMKCAVIDIGSNSMRLTAFDVNKTKFKVLFREKAMAGLAGYVEEDKLSSDGVHRACEILLSFKEILKALKIDKISIFATASLRNVSNTEEALCKIKEVTGMTVEIISGEQEAVYGYLGAMCELSVKSGVYMDIGGASTELAAFSDGTMEWAESFPIGSLKLYRNCVKKILPGKSSLQRIQSEVKEQFKDRIARECELGEKIVCVGGTSRAVLKLAKKVFQLPADSHTVTAVQLEELFALLCRGDREAIDLILKTDPERIHTLIPGMAIMRYIVKHCEISELMVSKYGVREGYLCQRIQTEL